MTRLCALKLLLKNMVEKRADRILRGSCAENYQSGFRERELMDQKSEFITKDVTISQDMPPESSKAEQINQPFSQAASLRGALLSMDQSNRTEPNPLETSEIPADPIETPAELERDITRTLAERHPDWPKLNFHFYFAAHGTKKDWADFAPQLKGADVCLLEGAGHTEKGIQDIQSLADSQDLDMKTVIDQNPRIANSYRESRDEALLGSGIAVGSIDLRNSVDAEQTAAVHGRKAYDRPIRLDGSFEDMIKDSREVYGGIAEAQRAREELITKNIEAEMQRILDSREGLGEKSKLRVLLSWGAIHTSLFRDLAQNFPDITMSRSFSEKPYIYSYTNETIRHDMFNVKGEVSDEVLARAYIEKLVYSSLQRRIDSFGEVVTSHDDVLLYARDIASQFSVDEAKAIFDDSKTDKPRPFESFLLGKDLRRIPSGNAELRARVDKIRAEMEHKFGRDK